jgi:hypothetical protein
VRIDRGTHRLSPLVAWIARLPPASTGTDIELTVTECGQWQSWRRQFGGVQLTTIQTERNGLLVERYGPFECSFEVAYDGKALVHRQVGAAIAWGILRIPLPRLLAPRVAARTSCDEDAVLFRVEVAAPVVGSVVTYEGRVVSERST